jgi:hypothetical protein
VHTDGKVLRTGFKLEVYGGSDRNIAFILEADETPDYISLKLGAYSAFLNYIEAGI